MAHEKYFVDGKTVVGTLIKTFVALLFVFAVAFFLWSVMKYNKIMEEKAEKEAYIEQLWLPHLRQLLTQPKSSKTEL